MNANAERAEAAGTLALFAEAQHSVDAYLTMDNRVEVVATDHADAATKTFTSTAAVPGLVGANATDYAVRVTWNADVGVGFSYVRVSGDTADTAPTYGPLGTTVTTGIEPVILSRTRLRVGADSAGVDEMSGRVYWTRWRNSADMGEDARCPRLVEQYDNAPLVCFPHPGR